jgi:hypothetical protein
MTGRWSGLVGLRSGLEALLVRVDCRPKVVGRLLVRFPLGFFGVIQAGERLFLFKNKGPSGFAVFM